MPLFLDNRDAGFFRRINEEYNNNIIDVQVAIYKFAVNETKINLYEEAEEKKYYNPVWVHCLVTRDDQSYTGDEYGQSYNQTIRFAFLKDTLIDLSLVPEVGDIIEFNQEFYEIDTVIENQFLGSKNPQTQETSTQTHGYNLSMVCNAHLTDRTIVQIEEVRSGISKNDYDIPSDL